jgi:hypothetical protein
MSETFVRERRNHPSAIAHWRKRDFLDDRPIERRASAAIMCA